VTADVRPLAKGQTAFAIDLYGRLKAGGGNVLFSAYSIQTALAMVRSGARGRTAVQMGRVLHLPPEEVPEAWKALVAEVTTPPAVRVPGGPKDVSNTAYTLSVANALWAQKGYPIVPAYRDLVASSYGAELREADFAQGPKVRREINDWVLSKTNDKIKDLIPEGLPTPNTCLALVDAIHFAAQWDEPFHERDTSDESFTNAKGERVTVRMMHRTDHWSYFDDAEVQVVSLRYRQEAVDMLVALPKRPDGLADLEAGLTPKVIDRWANGQRTEMIALALPRFRFEAARELSGTLRSMGMIDAFSPVEADFRGIADLPGQPLFIGPVLHKAFIAVDEKGTEAAAATAVLMKREGLGSSSAAPIPFVCDRPFFFLLRHRATGAVLFMGRLSMPEPGSRS
jgi:serpin B